jgi:hypothetical protein
VGCRGICLVWVPACTSCLVPYQVASGLVSYLFDLQVPLPWTGQC